MSISPHSRSKSWLFQITALSMILGILLALSLKTQRQAFKEGIPTHMPDIRAALGVTKKENLALQKDLTEYKERVEKMAKEQAEGLSSSKRLNDTLTEAKLLAGIVAVQGSGIIVTLSDSKQLDKGEKDPDTIENFLVHDNDIKAVVNELFAAGAEAISINNQRLIASSSIRCVGPAIMVNSVPVSHPFVIKAIGKPNELASALSLPGGPAEPLFLMEMLNITKSAHIVIPAFEGSTRFHIARQVGVGG